MSPFSIPIHTAAENAEPVKGLGLSRYLEMVSEEGEIAYIWAIIPRHADKWQQYN